MVGWQATYHLVFLVFSWWRMSARTRGVAVAVSAIIGTLGYLCRSSLRRL